MSLNINIAITDGASEVGAARSAAHSAAIQRYRDAINSMRVADDGSPQPLRDDASLYPLRHAFLAEMDQIIARY